MDTTVKVLGEVNVMEYLISFTTSVYSISSLEYMSTPHAFLETGKIISVPACPFPRKKGEGGKKKDILDFAPAVQMNVCLFHSFPPATSESQNKKEKKARLHAAHSRGPT